jgi:hypothetical protein
MRLSFACSTRSGRLRRLPAFGEGPVRTVNDPTKKELAPMDELEATVTVTALAKWPNETVERAYGLLSGSVARRLRDGDDPNSRELRELRIDAELFGMELVQRGLL